LILDLMSVLSRRSGVIMTFLRGNRDFTTLIVVPCCWLLQWHVPLNAFHHGPTQDKEGANGCYHVALQ
jgi:hypothetical protein